MIDAGALVIPFRGYPDDQDPLKRDFRPFLCLVWRHLGLPDPTELQYSMGWWLQHGPERSVIMAFRGAAKSWITAAYVLWVLYCNPQLKILVVSGSLKRAVAFTNFCLSLIRDMPLLAFLEPLPTQRQSGQAFDVAPTLPDQTPSFHASGNFGQIVGFRGDIIVADDVETNTNSLTTLMREKIAEAVKEYDSILKPGGQIKFLGTPHNDDSVYNKLPARGYTIRIWPAKYPDEKQVTSYGDKLAPFIKHMLAKDPSKVGSSTEPTRFSDADLEKRRMSLGTSTFALQWMLDTTLADADRYPLKLRNLIVLALDPRRGPDHVSWGNAAELTLSQLPVTGFEGDHFFGPANIAETFSKWDVVTAWLDPSGMGKDQTALCIIALLNGMLYCLKIAGWQQGFSPETLRGISKLLVEFNVSECEIEEDYADGMLLPLLQPYVEKSWALWNKAHPKEHGGTTLTNIRSARVQKERRILSVLEPLTQQHRLVMNKAVIEDDFAEVKKVDGEETRHRYGAMYQLTHLTSEKDCLSHDDKVEALAGACLKYASQLGIDPMGLSESRLQDRTDEELEKLFGETDEIAGHTAHGLGFKDRMKAALPHRR